MSALATGLCLAVIASIALNSSYMLQHAGSANAPDVNPRRPFATLRGLFASRLWTVGAALGITGWAVHIGALAHAPLSLVQAFVAGGMGLMAPIAAHYLRQRMAPLEWLAVALVVLSLLLLSLGLHDPGRHAAVDSAALAVFVAVATALAGLLVLFVRSWRAHALGLAGGILYGTADTTVKALTGIASNHGILAVLSSPWLAAAVATTAAAFFAFQRGLQTGRAIPVVVLMTGGTTVVSIIGGFAVFGDPLGRTPLLAYIHLVGFVLVTIASALLAPATQGEELATVGPGPQPDPVETALPPLVR